MLNAYKTYMRPPPLLPFCLFILPLCPFISQNKAGKSSLIIPCNP